jgi:hypothetical protein
VDWALGSLSLAPGLLAVLLSLVRAFELAITAPLAVAPFAHTLTRLLRDSEWERARVLCESLWPAWGARLASRALRARSEGEDIAFTLELTGVELRTQAERHLDAIRTLGRIAIPLALASAIFELGLGFHTGAHVIEHGAVQSSLDGALRVGINGVASALFCQWSVAGLLRQARARIDELRIVADVLTTGMLRTTR